MTISAKGYLDQAKKRALPQIDATIRAALLGAINGARP